MQTETSVPVTKKERLLGVSFSKPKPIAPEEAADAVALAGGPHRTLTLGHRATANMSRMRWTRAVTTITTVRVFNKTTTRAELERELSYRPKANEWRRQTRKRSHR